MEKIAELKVLVVPFDLTQSKAEVSFDKVYFVRTSAFSVSDNKVAPATPLGEMVEPKAPPATF